MKRIVALHDLACFGRSSLTTVISVLSSKGLQCCPIPTAVFSTHTAFENFVFRDLTCDVFDIASHFASLNIEFDSIYTGFLASSEQIDEVLKICKLLNGNNFILVDPVMGDEGKIYKTYTPHMCNKMRELVKIAHVITPNITEAKILLDIDPKEKVETEQDVLNIILKLHENFKVPNIVITGLSTKENHIGCAVFSGDCQFIYNEQINAYFPGTGDLFASLMLSEYLNGSNLLQSVKYAADFTSKAIKHTNSRGTPPLYGVEFESLL